MPVLLDERGNEDALSGAMLAAGTISGRRGEPANEERCGPVKPEGLSSPRPRAGGIKLLLDSEKP